jgi:hypothetical protein
MMVTATEIRKVSWLGGVSRKGMVSPSEVEKESLPAHGHIWQGRRLRSGALFVVGSIPEAMGSQTWEGTVMTQALKIGDVVQLNSGGSKMTVAGLQSDGAVRCV